MGAGEGEAVQLIARKWLDDGADARSWEKLLGDMFRSIRSFHSFGSLLYEAIGNERNMVVMSSCLL